MDPNRCHWLCDLSVPSLFLILCLFREQMNVPCERLEDTGSIGCISGLLGSSSGWAPGTSGLTEVSSFELMVLWKV